eukprot:PhM_4_TR3011/c2_g1_i1/m.89508
MMTRVGTCELIFCVFCLYFVYCVFLMSTTPEDRIKELEREIVSGKSQLDKWKAAVKNQLSEAESKNRLLHSENTELRGQLERLASEVTLRVRQQLGEEFSARHHDLEAQHSYETTQLRQELADVRERLSAEQDKLEEILSERSVGVGAEDQIATLHAMLTTAREDLKRYQLASAQYSESMKDVQRQCDRTVQEATASLRIKAMELEVSEKRVADLEKQNSELLKVKTFLEDEGREREDALNSLFQTQHKQVFFDLKQEVDALESKNKRLHGELEEARAKCFELENDNAKLEQELADTKEESSEAVDRLQQVKNKATESETRLREAYREITMLKVAASQNVSAKSNVSRTMTSAATIVPIAGGLSSSGVPSSDSDSSAGWSVFLLQRVRQHWRRIAPWLVLAFLVLVGYYNSFSSQQQESCKDLRMQNQVLTSQYSEAMARLEQCKQGVVATGMATAAGK